MNVLIIPEDHTHDHFLLKPIFTSLFATLGRPRANIRICDKPRLRGVQQATHLDTLRDIIASHRMTDIFILCVNRDGDLNRKSKLNGLETALAGRRYFLAENAWEELETWALAGIDLPIEFRWTDVRPAISVKEHFFAPVARALGIDEGPGEGRKEIGRQAARRLQAIRRKCPEDFDNLANRLQAVLSAV